MNKPGRNDPCPCGSGKKYKKCCGLAPQRRKIQATIIKSGDSSVGGRIGQLTSRISQTPAGQVQSEALERLKTKKDESNNP